MNNMRINQHVVKKTGGWAVVGEGNSRDTSIHRTQDEAIKRALQIASNQGSEAVIHREDGGIVTITASGSPRPHQKSDGYSIRHTANRL